MRQATELEDAFRRTAVAFTGLLALCSDEPDHEGTEAFHAALTTAGSVLEKANEAVSVVLAQRRTEAATRQYLKARSTLVLESEKERKETVTLLMDAVLEFRRSNERFAGEELERSERLEKVGEVDDLRTLRAMLRVELTQMREAIRNKETNDQQQFSKLRHQVHDLEDRLTSTLVEARHDPLSGLFNRAAWEQRMVELESELLAGDTGYAVVVMDLDHFKLVNDEHGHAAGDQVLADFGAYCRQSFGADDFLARYGGDEFAALMRGASSDNATEQLDRLQGLVNRSNGQRGGRAPFTVSMGLARAVSGDTVAALVGRADAALYDAKRSGRNRYLLAA